MVRATKVRTGGEGTRDRQCGRLALLVLCGAMFLDSLDVSLIGVALPSIEQDLVLAPATLQWLVSGYTVAYGGFLLLGGRTADLFGRRRVFLAAMVLFAAASLVGGMVTDGTLLMVSRVLKGVAAAFTAPAALSIITTTFPEGPERNRALGVYAATAASGYSLGLVLSGVLTQLHWRLVFLLPAVVAALVVVVAVRVLRGDEPTRSHNRGYDPLGAITVTAGLLLLVYGLTEAPESGWGSASTVGVLAVAAALLVAFLVIEHRHPDPGVPLRIFASRTLSAANALGVIFLAASIGWQFIATLYLQRTLEYSPLQTAFAFLPLGVMVFLVAEFAAERLISRAGIRTVATVGFLFQGVGIGLFAFGGIFTDYVSLLLPAVVLHGLGNGLIFPAVNIAGLSGVANQQQGLASGLITASTQIGAGIGVAVATGVSTGGTRLLGYQYAFAVAAGISVLGAVVAALGLGRVRRTDIAERTTPA